MDKGSKPPIRKFLLKIFILYGIHFLRISVKFPKQNKYQLRNKIFFSFVHIFCPTAQLLVLFAIHAQIRWKREAYEGGQSNFFPRNRKIVEKFIISNGYIILRNYGLKSQNWENSIFYWVFIYLSKNFKPYLQVLSKKCPASCTIHNFIHFSLPLWGGLVLFFFVASLFSFSQLCSFV